ncbi:aminopeptidase P family protein [Helicobacter heilmannii]|uniref:aminopeptidase P family protein n=1 Tax=Helicobacter heilmannii TaxID=35817 RepID=UPI0006A14756|nr:aminopeptidase P family protein [Helicobacter heilmannii]GMB94531.1 Proline peptidase PepQ [Helicobacter heilmannii]CRF45287.1 Aminopeptidase YpdF (MP-, MA-, MS-, AP-, NP-specific) [Helicobacter heilmannii]CRF47120.1 Aminopeptidase YpdF (MP-, MA-, MS-, AP-, NP-specific) [Helicobacter heilmannii]CRF49595.1 Aminopeptidase YpdF (MP-, MA-, MS-, AP-, NP-specific) [Helicobacter heilmannii]
MAHFTTDENAQYFACGYSCDHAVFLQLEGEAFFITDGRYTLEARTSIKNAEVIEAGDLWQAMVAKIPSSLKELYFDPAQLSVQTYGRLKNALPDLKFVGEVDYHRKQRIIKTPEQIALLKKAQELNVQAFDAFAQYLHSTHAPSEHFLQFKVKEFLTHRGEYPLSFEPIVAVNANAAKPHALPSKNPLSEGDLLLVDIGLKYERYCADRTRTAHFYKGFGFAKEQSFKDKELQKIYAVVLKAQEHAIAHLRAGMTGREIDSLARSVIEKAGFGAYFAHSTGHGIGLDIHELPFISQRSETIIEEGMVFSIEPGIYLPGKFGVRIEDLVVVQGSRAVVL